MASSSTEPDVPLEHFLKDYDYFMALALLTAQRNSDPDKQVGACLVKDNEVIAVGYNRVLNDHDEEKYPCECHAEIDAIMNCADVKGCIMFVTVFPCNECVKLIVQAGIESVVYLSDNPNANQLEKEAAEKMLGMPNSSSTLTDPKKKKLKEEEAQIVVKKYQPESEKSLVELAKEPKKESPKQETKKQKLNSPFNIADSDSDYFMAVALLTSKRSRDPRSQVGACFVKDKKVIAVGHNQMPNGEDDGVKYTWKRDLKEDNKHLYVCHAELNATVSSTDLKGSIMYVTLFPCDKCATLLVHKDVKTVFYLSDKNADRDYTREAKKILNYMNPRFYIHEEQTLEIYLKQNIFHRLTEV